MNLFIYSDESGVLDKKHNDYFVFGGLILLGKESKDEWIRRYSHAEKTIRKSNGYSASEELKATRVTNKEKGKLYRSLNNTFKFGVIVEQQRVLNNIFNGKKDKQRYLDYVYKIAVKRALQHLIDCNELKPDMIDHIYFFVDEHTTATNGCYELKEGLEQELKNGTYNWSFNKYFPPLFPELKSVEVKFCNSESVVLVRAADIVANKIYSKVIRGESVLHDNLHIIIEPRK